MAEETTTTPPEESTPESTNESPVAVADPSADILVQNVDITDAGPCKKHVKVVVERPAIDKRFEEKFSKLAKESRTQMDGFRPGKAPRKILERRYKSAVSEEVRNEVLMASLEQLATENKISPLSPPNIDPDKLEIPEEGPFVYEFDVEVRPEFDLPSYKGLKLKKPIKTFAKADYEKEKRLILEPYGQLVPKEGADAVVALGDTITADVVMLDGTTELNSIKEVQLKVEKKLVLQDGVANDFGKQLVGAKPGDERSVDIQLSEQVANPTLKGKTITAKIKIHDIKYTRLPDLDNELLSSFGVRNADQFEELIELVLQRRLQYIQNQGYRQQILQTIGEASKWDLPRDLLVRQAKRAISRKIMEMQNAGMTEEQIRAREQLLAQDVLQSTAAALREHFVLQKIAELENLEIKDEDIDAEIEHIADREGENPRKVRARLEREDLIETLATDILERRALQIVLESAEYEEVPFKDDDSDDVASSVETQAIPGEMEQPKLSEEGEATAQS